MVKCIYKCEESGICCRSTSENHCKVVPLDTCKNCALIQEKPTIGDKQQLKGIIRTVLKLLPSIPENRQAISLLYDGLKV